MPEHVETPRPLEDRVAELEEQHRIMLEAFTSLAVRVDQATQVEEILRRAHAQQNLKD